MAEDVVWTVTVRGPLPGDLVERISRLHAAALRAQRTEGALPSPGDDVLGDPQDGHHALSTGPPQK